MIGLILTCSLFAPPAEASAPATAPAPELGQSTSLTLRKGRRADRRGFREYLSRPVTFSPRFLDHGVLAAGVAAGYPHLYRLDLGLGLLDHITLGISAHWLPGQSRPSVVPRGSLAIWRGRVVEAGLSYVQVLHAPPDAPLAEGEELPEDERPPVTFPQRTHYGLGTFSFSRGLVAAGIDLGIAHLRQPHPDPEEDPDAFVKRVVAAGGIHVRVGTRRWGVVGQALMAPAK
jgi:hypothetical protein